ERARGLLELAQASPKADKDVVVRPALDAVESLLEELDLEVLLVVLLVGPVARDALELGHDHEAADRAEPDAEVLVGLELADLLVGADEGLLDDLVDEGGVGDAEGGVGKEHVLVAGDDRRVGIAIAGEDPPESLAQVPHAVPISGPRTLHYMQIRGLYAYIVYPEPGPCRGGLLELSSPDPGRRGPVGVLRRRGSAQVRREDPTDLAASPTPR